jgi:hypothetical protein
VRFTVFVEAKGIGFDSSKWPVLRILKKMGFRYKKCIDGRNLPMEQSDTVAAIAVFLHKLHKIKVAELVFVTCTKNMGGNENHTKKC